MAIIDIRNSIIRMEGVNPNYVPNNNPGNIRYSISHPEYTPNAIGVGAGGFAKYASYDDGVADLDRQIQIDANRGLSLDQFVSKYAPPVENKTSIYLSNLSNWLGVTPNTKLSNIISGDVGSGSDEVMAANTDVMNNDPSSFDFNLSDVGGDMMIALVIGGIVGGYMLLK